MGRELRNAKEALRYPFWVAGNRRPPDNHYYKIARINRIRRRYQCDTLIETGTYFGQTVSALKARFSKVLSVELSDGLYETNREIFRSEKTVRIFHGDSADLLGEMIDASYGRIVFWLDGHYSDGITALGESVTPILNELCVIKQKGRKGDCVLIDDIRLFVGRAGYPKIDEVKAILYGISADVDINVDGDCLMALPRDVVYGA